MANTRIRKQIEQRNGHSIELVVKKLGLGSRCRNVVSLCVKKDGRIVKDWVATHAEAQIIADREP
jgi:hypothetical protein